MNVIRIDQAREILAAVASTLGFQPTDALVLVGLRGNRHTLGPVIRIDLPALEDPTAVAHLVTLATTHSNACLLITYTPDNQRPAGRRAASTLTAALDEARHPVLETLWVTPTAYGSATCADPDCCPPTGHPLSDLDSTLIRATDVTNGRALVPTRADLIPAPATPAARRLAEAARAAWTAEHPATNPAHTRDALQVWTTALATPADVDPSTYGHLAAVLTDPTWRDLVITHAATDGTGINPETATARTDAIRAMLALPGEPTQRPGENLPAALDLLMRTAAHATGSPAAHAWAATALLAWYSGHGARAALAAEAAHNADPDNTLAALATQILAAQIPPAWTQTD
ncbi:DUF4192 domain-containing protein [uncultured Pseudokineococcus sp.]|uniref:DUF4192 domain-containing protein n=1 Tax=uncultured Pseudokineococcus sp. TaxID=1642928 RepID=UPI0026056EFE|nr:DUF4192 domain-containing protein [uncultured Pseudokineococcus sp.]